MERKRVTYVGEWSGMIVECKRVERIVVERIKVERIGVERMRVEDMGVERIKVERMRKDPMSWTSSPRLKVKCLSVLEGSRTFDRWTFGRRYI